MSSLQPRFTHAWQRHLLRALVHAHLVLNTNGNADPAIRCFFDLIDIKDAMKLDCSRRVEQKKDVQPSPVVYVGLWPATVQLTAALVSGKYPNTETSLYDDFFKFRRNYSGKHHNEDSKEFSHADLDVCHPRKPSAETAVRYIT